MGRFWFNVGSLILRRQGCGGQGGLDRLPGVIIGYYRLLSVTYRLLWVTVGYRGLLMGY